MVLPAARAMRALAHAAREAGFELAHVGAYRSYDQQVALFNQRYTTKKLKGRPTKVWKGVTYWQKPRTAMAAVPGTSNHGWGLAIDLAEKKNGKTVSITGACVAWLLANAAKYGYSWEAQSEPWHVRYVSGNRIPRAVKRFEKGGIQ
jgi:LAS superfamily LD-carboxypeptidase LdcB